MVAASFPYIPGRESKRQFPLNRYLPPLPSGIASSWLKSNIPAGSWILDPFGASPQVALEIARAGYRLLMTVNNPILAFMVETQSLSASVDEYQAALAILASTRKGEERLEKHIQSLYTVECPQCHNLIPAQALLVMPQIEMPFGCLIECPFCHTEGEQTNNFPNISRMQNLSFTGLHHSRALERVALSDDPIRPQIETALTCYSPRQLYALFSIINRAEGLSLPPQRRRLLTALILSACDAANTIWPYPTQRNRPRQLVAPNNAYKENNLWNSLEEAVKTWQPDGTPVPCHRWPDQPPPTGGICFFPGRLRELAPQLASISTSAIVTSVPRPNQAFWTLSAIWSGWLWGREAIKPIKNVLSRQRYDWNWLAGALEAALNSLQPQVKPETPFFFLMSEIEPSYLSALLLAADSADLDIKGIALRDSDHIAQIHMKSGSHIYTKSSTETIETIASNAIHSYLVDRCEPAPYLDVHTAGMLALAQTHALKPEEDQPLHTNLPHISTHMLRLFTESDQLISFGSNPNTPENNLWWLKDLKPGDYSLADRVEMEIVRLLQENPGKTFYQLDELICTLLTGLKTPPLDLVQTCLESYGEKIPPGGDQWNMRPSEIPANHRKDIKEINELMIGIGIRLGFNIVDGNPMIWQDEKKSDIASFFLTTSAIISRFIYANERSIPKSYIILPESRTNLLSLKLDKNPMLRQALAKQWHIVKFRHIAHLAGNVDLNPDNWEDLLNSDPLDYKATQMEIF